MLKFKQNFNIYHARPILNSTFLLSNIVGCYLFVVVG